jgi:hypothetical protein
MVVHDWISDLHADMNPATGYLVKEPKGFYGKRVKELVQYARSLSVEIKAIQHSRQARTHPCLQYFFSVFQFLSDTVFPVLFALIASYYYYSWAAPVEEQPVLIQSNTTSEWTSHSAGEWLGNSIRSVLSVPVQFVAGTLDRGLHLEEAVNYMQSTGIKVFLLPLLFLVVYIATKILGRLIIHVQTLCSAHTRVWFLQEVLLNETDAALERAIVGFVRPHLITEYEKLLPREESSTKIVTRSDTLKLSLYQDQLPVLRMQLFETIAAQVRATPFAELIQRGNMSALYAKTIHALIRHADEDLSSTMFAFHEEINQIPHNAGIRLKALMP